MRNVNGLVRFLVALVCLISVVPSMAESQPGRKDRSGKPINVKADRLEADNKGKMAVFTGRVVSRQEDVTIYSDRLEIYYGENTEDVDKVIAIGNVRIVQANRVGTGGHAVYENKEGKIILSIHPKVTQEKDSVTGKVITYYLDEDRSVADSGDNTRVEAVIHPKPGGSQKKTDVKKLR